MLPANHFEGHHEIGDEQGVFEEDGADGLVLGGPVDLAAWDIAVLGQHVGSPVAQAMGRLPAVV